MSHASEARARIPVPTPSGWTEKYSRKYERTFWKNIITGEKVWDKPKAVAIAAPVETSKTIVCHDAPTEVGIPTRRSNTDRVSHKAIRDENPTKDRSNRHQSYEQHQNYSPSTEADDDRNQYVQGHEESLTSTKRRGKNHSTRMSEPPQQIMMVNDTDWIAHHSRKYDRTYWKNRVTNKSSWSCPTGKDPSVSHQTASHVDDVRHSVTPIDTSPSPPNKKLKGSKSRGEGVQTPTTSMEVCKIQPLQSDEMCTKTSSNIRSKTLQKNMLSSDAIQAAAYVDVTMETKDNVSAEGRWEMRYSRKSGKKYWRDVVSGATTWRLSATALQKADQVVSPIDVITSKQQRVVMTKRIEDEMQCHASPSKQRQKLRQSPPPPKPYRGSKVPLELQCPSTLTSNPAQKQSQSQSQSQIDGSPLSNACVTIIDPDASNPADGPLSVDIVTPAVAVASSSGEQVLGLSPPLQISEIPYSAVNGKDNGKDMNAIEPPRNSTPLPLPAIPVHLPLPLALAVPVPLSSSSTSSSDGSELKKKDRGFLDMDLHMPWDDFSHLHCSSNPLWGALLMPLPVHLHAGYNGRY